MDEKAKRALIKALSQASTQEQPITIRKKNKPLAVVLPIADYQKLQDEQEKKLKLMKTELDGLLKLVRNRSGRQSLEEVEARLAALRRQIEKKGK
jgi:prevent-host-death family protein